MIQRSTMLCLAVAAAGAAATFLITDEARQREEELARLNRAIVASQEAIHVLRAEWSYLNRPERLKELAAHHLGMGPIPPQRMVRLDDLPVRPPEGMTEPLPPPDPKIARRGRPTGGTTLRASVERAQ